jgi:hypothetical protein
VAEEDAVRLDADLTPYTVTLDCDDSPEDARLRWTLRPLTAAEIDAARTSAGARPVRGARVLDALADAPDRRAYEESLSSSDAAALHDALEWLHSQSLEIAAAALVAVDDRPVSDPRATLASIRPASLYRAAVQDLAAHIVARGELDPKAHA